MFDFKKFSGRLGMMVHTYNPSYSGGRNQELGSRPGLAKSQQDPISTNKTGVMAHTCNPPRKDIGLRSEPT
jgi:hypothetical protein